MKIIGIYKIECIINNKVYIGYSCNIKKRKSQHFDKLKSNTHCNTHLQSSFNKYGIDNFEFSIIETCDFTDLKKRENYWCKEYKSHNRLFGYNVEPTTDDKPTCRSEETKKKLSIANKGKKLTEEQKDKIKLARSKQIITEDHKKAISLSNKGKRISEEQKLQISIKNKENGKNYKNLNLKKPIIQKDIEGNIIQRWNGIADTAKTGLYNASKVCLCCQGKRNKHKGYKWEYLT